MDFAIVKERAAPWFARVNVRVSLASTSSTLIRTSSEPDQLLPPPGRLVWVSGPPVDSSVYAEETEMDRVRFNVTSVGLPALSNHIPTMRPITDMCRAPDSRYATLCSAPAHVIVFTPPEPLMVTP